MRQTEYNISELDETLAIVKGEEPAAPADADADADAPADAPAPDPADVDVIIMPLYGVQGGCPIAFYINAVDFGIDIYAKMQVWVITHFVMAQ